MIVAVGFLPAAPILISEVASGAAYELDGLRESCMRVIRDVTARPSEGVVMLAAGEFTGWLADDATGSMASFGVHVEGQFVGSRSGAAQRESVRDRLTYGHVVGSWLLDRTGYRGVRRAMSVAGGGGSTAAELLRNLGAPQVLFVMGDGSARLSVKAPGYFDAGAKTFDEDVTQALASGDPSMLVKLDGVHAAQQMSSGFDAWQAAGLALQRRVTQGWQARSDYEAPYGVGYVTASWT